MLDGRPRPVQAEIPFNLFQEDGGLALQPSALARMAGRSGAAPEDVADTAQRLLTAQRRVLFIVHGVALSEFGAALTALAERLTVPVIAARNGMGCIPMQHALSLGFIGRNYPVDLGIVADARTLLRQLPADLGGRGAAGVERREWLAMIDGWRAEWRALHRPALCRRYDTVAP